MKHYETRKVQLKRFYLSNHLYFITTVTEDRTQLFLYEENIRILLNAIKDSSNRYATEIHAFVILPDHMHLLVTPTTDTFTISDFMKGVKGKSAIEINKCRHEFIRANATVGTKKRVWQHQFLDHVIRNSEDYRRHIEYIHNNPIKHNRCKEPEEHKWSSYRYYMYDEDMLIQISKLPL